MVTPTNFSLSLPAGLRQIAGGRNSQSSIIFSESFAGLSNMDITGRKLYVGDPNEDAVGIPDSFDFLYTAEMNPTNPPGRINNGVLEVWDESAGTGSQWAWHDFQLMVFFAAQYPEFWLKFDIRFNPALNTTNFNAAKIARIGHYNPRVADGTTETSIFNTNNASNVAPYGNTTAGLVFWDLKDGYNKFQFRGGPTYTRDGKIHCYVSDAGGRLASQSYVDTYGDGAWHKIELRCVMDSAIGARNGIFEMWMDGIEQTVPSELWSNNLEFADGVGGMDLTSIEWRDDATPNGQPAVTGFNCFSLGGNADFSWAGDTAQSPTTPEQLFYSFRNVVASTTRQT